MIDLFDVPTVTYVAGCMLIPSFLIAYRLLWYMMKRIERNEARINELILKIHDRDAWYGDGEKLKNDDLASLDERYVNELGEDYFLEAGDG